MRCEGNVLKTRPFFKVCWNFNQSKFFGNLFLFSASADWSLARVALKHSIPNINDNLDFAKSKTIPTIFRPFHPISTRSGQELNNFFRVPGLALVLLLVRFRFPQTKALFTCEGRLMPREALDVLFLETDFSILSVEMNFDTSWGFGGLWGHFSVYHSLREGDIFARP